MIIRPEDTTGDILPVLSRSDMLSNSRSVAQLVSDRLRLFAGEWWENPSWGNRIIQMIRSGRPTEADVSSFSTYLSSYVRETEGVQAVEDVEASVSGRVFHWKARIRTADGPEEIRYQAEL